jgi:hypothetical protein
LYDLGRKYYKDEKKEMIVLKFNRELQERQNALRRIIIYIHLASLKVIHSQQIVTSKF